MNPNLDAEKLTTTTNRTLGASTDRIDRELVVVVVRRGPDPVVVGEFVERADGGEAVVAVVEVLVGEVLDVGERDGLDAREQLGGRDDAADEAEVGDGLGGDGRGRGEVVRERGLEVDFGARDFGLADVEREAHEVRGREPHGVLDADVLRGEVHPEERGVRVREVEGLGGGHDGLFFGEVARELGVRVVRLDERERSARRRPGERAGEDEGEQRRGGAPLGGERRELVAPGDDGVRVRVVGGLLVGAREDGGLDERAAARRRDVK
mmetsp:Transcript_970/g.3853  ORF Transcript_970/g.3853 Transcript_970/m.3853 type:complete len:266 (+) Transcript_970:319-1116(+)